MSHDFLATQKKLADYLKRHFIEYVTAKLMIMNVVHFGVYGFQWRIQDFPRGGGGANSQKCYYFSIFCRKLHENERIWTPGGRPWRPPLDPPMVLDKRRLITDCGHIQIVRIISDFCL